jgi:hypothetical protein
VIVAQNSYSQLQNKISMLRKASPTNPAVARIAVALANSKTPVAVLAVVVNNAKCMKLLAQLVAYKLKYRSVRVVTALYTAAIASAKTAAVVTNL